jgi:feruloyl esterase
MRKEITHRRIIAALLGALMGSATLISSTHAEARTCESLLTLNLPKTVMTGAQSIPVGDFTPPGSTTVLHALPAFCRVTATISPVPDSSIGIEVWLPLTTWNGKYQQSGDHGFGGVFFWGEMVSQIKRGYATGITNDGHTGASFDVSWGINHPEKMVDYAWRAVHELSEKAKLVIAAYYGRAPRYSYFNGCSDGGRQGLKAAQMTPDDFDGIIAGSGFPDHTGNQTWAFTSAINSVNAGMVGASRKTALTIAQNGATAACDALDGAIDGVIRDPRICHFDPRTLVCKSAGQSNCLTQAQADAIRANYRTVRDPVTGKYVMSGMKRGSEFNQITFDFTGPVFTPFYVNAYKLAKNDLNWDPATFDLHKDLPVLEKTWGITNAIDTDLRPFKKAGGKLIQWHGWDDGATTSGFIVKLYEETVEKTGRGNDDKKLEDVQDFYRLFMMPGVGHCGTGPGPDNIGAENQTAVSNDPEHDVVSALEAWVEKGVAPKKLIATKFINNDPTQGIAMQRPICPYPSEAVYKSGNTNDATSFVCGSPPQDNDRDHHRDNDDDRDH